MVLVKKKTIQIFSNGSVNCNNKTLLKKENKMKILTNDYLTLKFNIKNTNSHLNLEKFNNFKNKYLNFK